MASQPVEADQFWAEYKPHEQDVFILVMGMTGSGKSTFISHLAERSNQPEIGNGLQSCTQRTTVYRCGTIKTFMNLYLIDTPGFDHTNYTDSEVLEDIACWLARASASKIKLRGILYLRRINEMRARWSEVNSLLVFSKMCGPKVMRNVFMVTTMWPGDFLAKGKVPPDFEKVEQELEKTPRLWGWMKDQGAKIKRHYTLDPKGSAIKLIKELVPSEEILVLDIQVQMVSHRLSCGETNAGKVLECLFSKEAGRFSRGLDDIRKMVESTLRSPVIDQESTVVTAVANMLQQQKKEVQETLQRLERQQEELAAGIKALGDNSGKVYFGRGNQQGPPSVTLPPHQSAANAPRQKMAPRRLPQEDELLLCRAAEGGQYEDVSRMLKQGANPAMCGKFGWTALHWAAESGRTNIVELLLRHGAPVNAVSDTGMKPLNMAKTKEIKQLLLGAGATY
ncbi:Ankyrin-3 [Madurella mycetomatis]|uniref:Ankyrin-3 n=1 Tax=Madurella mycetomatis TaxID=100816 RepID=A0A175VXY4_9PEZI|nr:Ankyrin-3 [Madurella mycetomatis]